MRALDGMSITTAREALTAELTDKLLPHYLRDAKRWKLTYKRLMRLDEGTFKLIYDKIRTLKDVNGLRLQMPHHPPH